MKFVLFLFSLSLSFSSPAQVKTRTLKKTIELQMPGEAVSGFPGTRGASVAWHPVQKKYYAAMAGNAQFPMAIFDTKGNRVSSIYSMCWADTRGLWYNTLTKTIQGSGFDQTGWFNYQLDGSGTTLLSLDTIETGMLQPGPHCVGAFNPAAKTVLFLYEDSIHSYRASDRKPTGKNLAIQWGFNGKDEATSVADDYNQHTIIYTGIPKAELGFLNYIALQIELYNAKTGLLTQVLKLPEDVIAESSFNFAYANGTYWLFNIESRRWTGYQ
jgi:hypothetical protein